MNQHHSDTSQHTHTEPKETSTASRVGGRWQGKLFLGELVRGCTMGGAAFLLGSCPLAFGAAPLGIALLSAASSYTWYICAGLLLAAFLHPVTLTGWAWLGVYAFCIILRLCIRFFVDPPCLPDGRPCRGRTYLMLCWVSFRRNIGFSPDPEEEDHSHAYYYAGAGEEHPEGGRETVSHIGYRGPEVQLFAEHPFLRMLTAAVTGFAAGIIVLFTGHFHVYDLLGLLVLVVAAPLCTFLLVSCFGEAGMILLFSPTPLREAPLREDSQGHALSDRDGGMARITAHFHTLPLLAVSSLLVLVTLSARSYAPALGTNLLHVELSMLLGLLFTLTAAARLGAVPGVAVAVMCGLAAHAPSAPILILTACGYAILRHLSHRAGVIGGCTIGAVWCAAIEGFVSLAAHLPAIVLAIPIFLLNERLWEALPVSGERARADRELDDLNASVSAALSAESRAKAQRARLTALSEAFGALSKRLYNLSGQLRRPRMPDLRRLCDEAFGKQCARCRQRDICWGTEYDRTLEVQTRLTSRLHMDGRVSVEALPDSLLDFCPYMESIVDDINARCARLTEALAKSEKTEVFAADYAAIAALLGDALEADRLEAETMGGNREAADRIYDYLTESGVTVQGVVVSGKQESGRRRVIVRGLGFDKIEEKTEEMRRQIGEICGASLGRPQFEESPDAPGAVVMTLSAEPRLETCYSGSTVAAGTDKNAPLPPPLTHETPTGSYAPPAVCGDHIALFKTDDAYFYALISDGMGSGEDASLTSDICSMFLEKMLSAGNRVEISLRMLDGYIRAKNSGTGDECSATVDLMELDMMDGHAVFAKNGAAPTYVVREGVVYKLRSRTMPIGILRDMPPELLRFRMHPGDVVVMVSDGITQGHDECPWLIDLLSTPMPESMDALRTDIIRRALSSGSEDDLSAIAIRVEENVS